MGRATDGRSRRRTGKAPPAEGAEEKESSPSVSGEDVADDREGGSAASEEERDESQNPYLDKRVVVVRGRHSGIRGRIVEVNPRGGWWTVEVDASSASSSSPLEAEADGGRCTSSRKVKNSDCRMIDTVDADELKKFCDRTGIRLRLVPPATSAAAPRSATSSNSGSSENDESSRGDATSDDDGSAAAAGGNKRPRKRRGEHPGRDGEWKHTQPPDGVPPSWRDWRDSMSPHVIRRLVDASVPPVGVQYRRSRIPRRTVPRGGDDDDSEQTTPLLPPVTISPDDDTILPEAVRHLPPDSTVDMFDRVSGRILTGTNAVTVRDLPAVLRSHAEYEPVVPPPSIQDAASASVREGRSSHNVTVSASVKPQLRTGMRSSAVEGREVIVTGGRLRGRVGKIVSRLPGNNWYVVSDLIAQDGREGEYVISSAHLDLLGGRAESEESQPRHPDAGAAIVGLASGSNAKMSES